MLKLSQICLVGASSEQILCPCPRTLVITRPRFLAQDVSRSPRSYSPPALELGHFFHASQVPFSEEWHLETKICVLGVLIGLHLF